MNELQKELENVYQLIGRVAVSGDAVDLIAGARVALRRAFQMAETPHPSAEEALSVTCGDSSPRGGGKDERADCPQ